MLSHLLDVGHFANNHLLSYGFQAVQGQTFICILGQTPTLMQPRLMNVLLQMPTQIKVRF
jgi:hypothetical protein